MRKDMAGAKELHELRAGQEAVVRHAFGNVEIETRGKFVEHDHDFIVLEIKDEDVDPTFLAEYAHGNFVAIDKECVTGLFGWIDG